MTSYTITITRDDDAETTTTLRLDTSAGDAVLTDLHLHAGAGLPQGVLPAIDYAMLLQAINTSNPTPVRSAPASGRGATSGGASTRGGRKTAGRGGRAAARATAAAATGTRRGKPARAASAAVAGTRAGRAGKAAPAKKNATAARESGGRAYRRMPDDLAAVYARVGSASGIAAHYGVPRHTAYGWLRRLEA